MGEVFIDESSDRGSTPLISISTILDLIIENTSMIKFEQCKNNLALA